MTRFLCALAWIVAAGAPVGAVAQSELPPLERFSAFRFAPAPGPNYFLTVDGARISGHLVPSFGLILDYAHEPFVLYDATCVQVGPGPNDVDNCETTGVRTKLVSMSFAGNLFGTIALFDRLQIGLVVPLVLSDGDRFSYTPNLAGSDAVAVNGGSRFGLGDLKLVAKGRIYGDGGEGIGFAGALFVTAPLGQATADSSFNGDDSINFGGYFAAEFNHSSGVHVAANIGAFYRTPRTLFSTEVGSQLTYSLAAGYDLTPLVGVFGELQGASAFSAQVDENPLEGRLAGRYRVGDISLFLGGGAGLVAGVGVPVFRVFGGATWAPIRGDQDGDRVTDDQDACPDRREDEDGWMDDDGCPEEDNDNDGHPDGTDPCRDEAEDIDQFEDEDGCPDHDNDADGVRDGYDSCPSEPEDRDNDRDEDGCPDNDRDRDNIADQTDVCPDEPEDTDGFGDEDGCPEADFDSDAIPDDADECPDQPETTNEVNDTDGCPEADGDGDGIIDDNDRCPAEAETLNGRQDNDGCPDGDALIRVEGGNIVLLQQVQFGNNSDRIRGEQSNQVLDAVATILQRNPSYARVRIEGHTDNAGNRARNVSLSDRRARACMQYLVRRGIAAERLSAVGHGPDRPLTTNDTPEGRTMNRRVEFHIEGASDVQAAPTPVDPAALGAPAASPAPAPAPAPTPAPAPAP